MALRLTEEQLSALLNKNQPKAIVTTYEAKVYFDGKLKKLCELHSLKDFRDCVVKFHSQYPLIRIYMYEITRNS